MLYTYYFAKVKDLPSNTLPVAICTKPPTWWKGYYYGGLAPKYGFFQKWKQTHDNDYYVKCYNEQVLSHLTSEQVLLDIFKLFPIGIRRKLKDYSMNWWENPDIHVVLLCYEKSSDFCHRHLVAQWFQDNGIEVREWSE